MPTRPPIAVERLPLRTRIAYGAPNFGLAIVGIPILIYLPRFYTDVVGLSVFWLGVAFVAGRVIDAITDPMVGWLSDRSRFRMGRRRPWIVWGCVPLALLSVAVYVPTTRLPQDLAMAWAGVVIVGWFLAYTAVAVPYRALGPELTDDYDERTTLFSFREGLLVVGILIAATGPGLIDWALGLDGSPDDQRTRFAWYIAITAPILVITCLWCVGGVSERFAGRPPPGRSPREVLTQLRQALRNRPFLILVSAFMAIAIGGSLPSVLISYFVTYVLKADLVPLFVGIYFLVGLCCVPMWLAISRRKGKKTTWLAAMVVNAGFFAGVAFVGEGDVVLYGVLVGCSGIAGVAALALPYSMQADVIDHDELITGQRREGLYGGLWSIAEKMAAGLGLGLSMLALDVAGYRPNVEQTPLVLDVLRGLYIGVPVVCTAAGFLIAWRYPIDRAAHQEIAAGLRRRDEG